MSGQKKKGGSPEKLNEALAPKLRKKRCQCYTDRKGTDWWMVAAGVLFAGLLFKEKSTPDPKHTVSKARLLDSPEMRRLLKKFQ